MKLSGFSLRLGKHGRVYFRTGGTSKSAPRASAPQAPAAPRLVYREPYTLWGMTWRICLAAMFAMNIYAAYIYGEFPRFLYSCVMCAAMTFFSVRYCLRYHRATTAPIQAEQDSTDAASNAPIVPTAPIQSAQDSTDDGVPSVPINGEPEQEAPQPIAEAETPVTPASAAAWQAELDDMAKAERLQAQIDAEAAARASKHKTVPILLELDMSPEHQQALKDLKLKMVARGLRGELVLQQDDSTVSVLLDDFVLGKASTADALWIDKCFSYIDAVPTFEVLGGGCDARNEPRPFMVVANLSVHGTAPGVPTARDFSIPPARRIWGVKSDAVCYASSTGTVHLSFGPCDIGADWTPMFVFDAAEQGLKPCSKCF